LDAGDALRKALDGDDYRLRRRPHQRCEASGKGHPDAKRRWLSAGVLRPCARHVNGNANSHRESEQEVGPSAQKSTRRTRHRPGRRHEYGGTSGLPAGASGRTGRDPRP